MAYFTRSGGIRISALHVLIGPLVVFLLHVGPFKSAVIYAKDPNRGLFAPGFSMDDVNGLLILALGFYYVIGLLPAVISAEMTKYALRNGLPVAWWSAGLAGAVASLIAPAVAIAVRFPLLELVGVPNATGPLPVFAATFVVSFLATLPCWFATRRLQRRYAAG
jgi:hypothetical protein